MTKGTVIPAFAKAAQSIVIDEIHSFIGTERGKQVQSLLHRLEVAAERKIPRIGLSATLGDKSLAAEYLRPGFASSVETIDAGNEGYELKLTLKGFSDSFRVHQEPRNDDSEAPEQSTEDEDGAQRDSAQFAIADYLFSHLRGSNNLIFPNSRSKVEFYADQLRRRCEREGVPNEFWPHHGSLSREIREESEAALKNGERSASAVCTTTLELGIDIGSIRSVAQIGPPPSVASLRQRLGRSGRRAGEPAILRCMVVERELTRNSGFSDRIREGLVQTIAMIRLLIRDRWVEPPSPEALHVSTLVQQILSVIAQKGGTNAAELWIALVKSGVFRGIEAADFTELLRTMGTHDLITQDHGGTLLPGLVGEKLINHFDFYSAFTSGEEFRIVAEGQLLGSLPIERPLTTGQRIIFAGRRWKVYEIDQRGKMIFVVRDRGGAPPSFDGTAGAVHNRVRQEMRQVLTGQDPVPFLDSKAAEFLNEARQWFTAAGLDRRQWFVEGSSIVLLGWQGDSVHDALALLLTARGMHASNEGAAIRVFSTDQQQLVNLLGEIGPGTTLIPDDLHIKPEQAIREKWDWTLPVELRIRSYVSAHLDLSGAHQLAIALSNAPGSATTIHP